jgi:Na+-transporting NADH:ubiquinone oxidoreductase subunit NqrA
MGKVEFSIDVLTEEEHKRVLEFIDPGFTKLTIHKYKNEA